MTAEEALRQIEHVLQHGEADTVAEDIGRILAAYRPPTT